MQEIDVDVAALELAISKSKKYSICGSRRSEVYWKKGVLRNFTKFTGKYLCQSIFLNTNAGLSSEAFLFKKRLWRRCFPLNFMKFLRTPFLQNTSGGCFCICRLKNYLWIEKLSEDWRTICRSNNFLQIKSFDLHIKELTVDWRSAPSADSRTLCILKYFLQIKVWSAGQRSIPSAAWRILIKKLSACRRSIDLPVK